MNFVIREMTIRDYDKVIALWESSEGVGLSDADSKEGIVGFLDRNHGLSVVALDGENLVGAILCGHDGRRGYIHHLAVAVSHRRNGIGQALVDQCITKLKSIGIGKLHIFVFTENQDAIAFWEKIGWKQRIELTMLSQSTKDTD